MANNPIPEYTRNTEIQSPTSSPDFGGAFRDFASKTNGLGELGASIAQKAATTRAIQNGTLSGNTPHGDLLPAITDYDKAFADSYASQATAVISLQANKALSDIDLSLASANKINPEMITKANETATKSVSDIIKLAPTSSQAGLTQQYGSMVIGQNNSNQKRFIDQSKEEARQTVVASLDQSSTNLYQMAFDGAASNKTMNESQQAIETTIDQAVAAGQISVGQADVYRDTARQAIANGRSNAQLVTAHNQGGDKAEKYLASKGDGPAEGQSYADWSSESSSLLSMNGTMNSLKAQDVAYRVSDFKYKSLTDPSGITPYMMQEFHDNVPLTEFNNAMISGITTANKMNKQNGNVNALIAGWNNSDVMSQGTSENVNKAAESISKSRMANNPALSQNDANLQTAASAIVPIPSFINSLNIKSKSQNTDDLDDAVHNLAIMDDVGKNGNLTGFTLDARARLESYKTLKQQMPPVEAAQQSYLNTYGKTKEQKDANEEAYTDYIQNSKKRGETDTHFFLKMAGIGTGGMFGIAGTPPLVRNSDAYASDIRAHFKEAWNTGNSDPDSAISLTKSYVRENYGYTTINGKEEYTFHPIAQTLGLPDDADGVIIRDAQSQLETQFKTTNDAFKAGTSEFMWTVVPKISMTDAQEHRIGMATPLSILENKKRSMQNFNENKAPNKKKTLLGIFDGSDKTIKMLKTYKDGRTESFNVVIQASPFTSKSTDPTNPVIGGYEMQAVSKGRITPLLTLDPRFGRTVYKPNVNKLKNDYMLLHNVYQEVGDNAVK